MDWRTSREFFYWRLKRRLNENLAINSILNAQPKFDYQIALNFLQQWFHEDQSNQETQWNKDQCVVQWLEQFNQAASIDERIVKLKKQTAREEIQRFVRWSLFVTIWFSLREFQINSTLSGHFIRYQ